MYAIYKNKKFLVFTEGWESRWVDSEHKGAEQGKFVVTSGKFYGDEELDKGWYFF